MKYQPQFPQRFGCIQDAKAFCRALLLGDKHLISEQPESWANQLSSFTVELVRDDGISRRGHATHVLGGPLKALRFLVDELVRYPACEPLGPGEGGDRVEDQAEQSGGDRLLRLEAGYPGHRHDRPGLASRARRGT